MARSRIFRWVLRVQGIADRRISIVILPAGHLPGLVTDAAADLGRPFLRF